MHTTRTYYYLVSLVSVSSFITCYSKNEGITNSGGTWGRDSAWLAVAASRGAAAMSETSVSSAAMRSPAVGIRAEEACVGACEGHQVRSKNEGITGSLSRS